MAWNWWKQSSDKPAEAPKVDPYAPSTLAAEQSNPHLDRPIVFEPALKQHAKAHRAGEPRFESEAEAVAWYDCRLAVLHHILHTLSESAWKSNLILRGSALMGTWFGELARRPGDLDWVITPHEWHPQDRQSKELVQGVIGLLEGSSVGDQITIPRNAYASEEIWLYEKAPGLRIILPWQHQDVRRSGTVQMDFVFRERMPTPPQTTDVKLAGLPRVNLLAATPEQSLAWKLVWLATDSYAAGKDLYDAALLAEAFPISAATMHATYLWLAQPERDFVKKLKHEDVLRWDVDWDDFIKEYPFVPGNPVDWQSRLACALTPLFAGLEQYR